MTITPHKPTKQLSVAVTLARQRGYVTLITAILLLALLLIIGLYCMQILITERRVLNADYQSKQAFEAAEAGLEYGIAYLQANRETLLTDSDNNGTIDTFTPPTATSITQGTLNNNSTYRFSYSQPIPSNYELIQVTATGTSSDGLATSQVTQQVALSYLIAHSPQYSLNVLDSVDLSGNISIRNRVNKTIISGGDTNLSGSADTQVNDVIASNKTALKSDVVKNTTLFKNATAQPISGNNFFDLYFAASKADVASNADLYYSNQSNYSSLLNDVSGKTIWIDQTNSGSSASFSGNATIGTPSKPVVIIIDGNATLQGNVTINGFVYATGDLDIKGNVTINGAIASEGTFDGQGSAVINLDNTVMINLNNIGSFARVIGSWNDL